MNIYAKLTQQGTAAAETAVCDKHITYPTYAADTVTEPTDCTGNDALECVVCGVSA